MVRLPQEGSPCRRVPSSTKCQGRQGPLKLVPTEGDCGDVLQRSHGPVLPQVCHPNRSVIGVCSPGTLCVHCKAAGRHRRVKRPGTEGNSTETYVIP